MSLRQLKSVAILWARWNEENSSERFGQWCASKYAPQKMAEWAPMGNFEAYEAIENWLDSIGYPFTIPEEIEKMSAELNKDFILNVWLPALRSGAFPQCTNRLCSYNGFCCLGVAQFVAVGNGYISATESDNSQTALPSREFADFAGFYNLAIRSSLMFKMRIPKSCEENEDLLDFIEDYLYASDHELTVVTLNDRLGLSFAQIADFIELNLEIMYHGE